MQIKTGSASELGILLLYILLMLAYRFYASDSVTIAFERLKEVLNSRWHPQPASAPGDMNSVRKDKQDLTNMHE